MKCSPLLFNAEMVKATLDGVKTQTRRVIKSQPCECGEIKTGDYNPVAIDRFGEMCPGKETYGAYCGCGDWGAKSKYGKPGDRLWVRETHYRYGKWIKNGISKTGKQKWKFKPTNNEVLYSEAPGYRSDFINIKPNKYRLEAWYKRPSIFMPRWASRITLQIKDIRVERVQDITTGGCKAEGWPVGTFDGNPGLVYDPRPWFWRLWDSINKKRGYGWNKNPWVWVIVFKRITP